MIVNNVGMLLFTAYHLRPPASGLEEGCRLDVQSASSDDDASHETDGERYGEDGPGVVINIDVTNTTCETDGESYGEEDGNEYGWPMLDDDLECIRERIRSHESSTSDASRADLHFGPTFWTDDDTDDDDDDDDNDNADQGFIQGFIESADFSDDPDEEYMRGVGDLRIYSSDGDDLDGCGQYDSDGW